MNNVASYDITYSTFAGECCNARPDPNFPGSLADTTGGSIINHAGGEVITPSGKSFGVPAQASLTVKQANDWQIKIGAGLETLVNLKATVREQAAQAVRMANDIMLAARNAMEDANAAAQLMMTNPIRTFNELLQTLGKEFSGDVLYKKVIEKAKAMVGQPILTARTITEAGGCFVAGTLVHTKDGLKPIEQIQVGDWVLSKPESGEGEQAYKRVVNTFSFEDKVVRLVEYAVLRNGEWHEDCVTTTNNHPFWVKGIDASRFPSVMTWEHLQTGWTRADHLFGGLLIELPTGETAMVRSNHRDVLWKTKRPGIAWEGTVSTDTGGTYRVANTGEFCPFDTDELTSINHDYNDDETFSARRENTEWEQKWLYTTKVYNFEVEDFHTYYVGTLGAWVHNTNCYETTVEYMKKHGVLPSIDNQAFHTKGQVDAIVAAMESAGIAPKGMILMQEKVTKAVADDLFWVKYQRGVENGLFKTINGDDYFFARTLIYKNPIAGGENMIRLGDGAASMLNGSQKVLSKTTIDSKGFQNAWSQLRNFNGQNLLVAKENLAKELVKMSAALKQNSVGIHQIKPFSHVLEFVDKNDLPAVAAFIKEVSIDPKWIQKYGSDWLSPNIYLAHNPFPGAVKRVLPDELIGFVKSATGQYIDQKISKQQVLIAMEQNQGFLADIKKIFGNNEPGYQLTGSANMFELTTDRLVSSEALNAVLVQAKAFWLRQGALASVLNSVDIVVEDLPQTAVARTTGTSITLSADAAGWGWFVDTTPAQNEEFAQLGNSQEYAAQAGSAAAGKIDLLGVLIHEIGHTLGLAHSDDAHDEMAATVSPGLRRLPDMETGVFAPGIGQTMHAAMTVSPAHSVATAQYVTAINPTLTNGSFATDSTGQVLQWEHLGNVQARAASQAGSSTLGQVTLGESTSAQAHVGQAFVLSAQDRFLTFTVSGLNLQTNSTTLEAAPQDAFEVALLNANTGANLLTTGTSTPGTSRSDALLNVQLASSNTGAALQERAASGLLHTDNPDGSRTYVLDLSGITPGTAVNLSFDRIGFGLSASQLGSKVNISDVRLISTPLAVADTATLDEDGSATITVQANDLNANAVGFAPRLVASAQHGQVSLSAPVGVLGVFGGFVYTPDANYFGTDSFTYQYSNADGTELSNTATVSLTVTAVNDAPVACDVPVNTLEDNADTINLVAAYALLH
jgi:hypothetical protein